MSFCHQTAPGCVHGPLKWGGAMAWTLGGWSSPERRGRWSQYSGRVEVGKMAKYFPRWLRWKRCLILWANNSLLFTMSFEVSFLLIPDIPDVESSDSSKSRLSDFAYEFGKFRESSNPGLVHQPPWLFNMGAVLIRLEIYISWGPRICNYIHL